MVGVSFWLGIEVKLNAGWRDNRTMATETAVEGRYLGLSVVQTHRPEIGSTSVLSEDTSHHCTSRLAVLLRLCLRLYGCTPTIARHVRRRLDAPRCLYIVGFRACFVSHPGCVRGRRIGQLCGVDWILLRSRSTIGH